MPMIRLMITPFIVGWLLEPLIAEAIKAITPIIRNTIIHIDSPVPIDSIVYLVKIVVHPAVEQGFSVLDRLGNQFFLLFD